MLNETDIKSMTPDFYDWLHEVENFGTRQERLWETFTLGDFHKELLLGWLKAAYNVGYNKGKADGNTGRS